MDFFIEAEVLKAKGKGSILVIKEQQLQNLNFAMYFCGNESLFTNT